MVRHQKCEVEGFTWRPGPEILVAVLHITNAIPEGSESFQPFENRGVRAPRHRSSGPEISWPRLLDRLSLHFQIDSGIAIRRRQTGMAQPLTNRGDLHA